MELVLLLIAPAVAFLALEAAPPRAGPPPRWRLLLASLLEKQARRLRRHESPPDPFDALRLQMRLGILADQLLALEAGDHVYAKAHRLQATRAAYDDLLEEACRLAGVDLDQQGHRGETERLRVEVELTARGWSW
jgi:hypothetical protein